MLLTPVLVNTGENDGELLVNFFNGKTVLIKRGVALRIPEEKYHRISLEIQLPESQRRKQASTTYSFLPTRPNVAWKDDRRELQLVNFFDVGDVF